MNHEKNGGKFAMTLVMLTIFIVMVLLATQYSAQARFMPLVVGIPGIALCLLQLYLDTRPARPSIQKNSSQPGSQSENAGEKIAGMAGREKDCAPGQGNLQAAVPEYTEAGERRREIVLWACMLALVAGTILFGFWITIPVFLGLFLRFFAGKGWFFSLGLGLGATAILYLVFTAGLGVALHGGFITEQILDRFAD